MTTKLYYFTGTGNSLKIARDIAGALGDAEIIPIAKALASEKIEPRADAIGIVFPVYIWGLPLIVERFAKKLGVQNSQYLFAVANFGGFPGGTISQIRKIFSDRGITLSAGFGVKMPGNYTPMYGAIADKKQQKMFEAEKRKIAYIADRVKSRASVMEEDNFLIKWLFSDVVYRFSAPHIPKMGRDFLVDGNCNGCGICAKLCPVGNIQLKDARPAWQDRCEQCLACLQWCPQEAIQLGKHTAGRKRYHHPEIKINDLM